MCPPDSRTPLKLEIPCFYFFTFLNLALNPRDWMLGFLTETPDFYTH